MRARLLGDRSRPAGVIEVHDLRIRRIISGQLALATHARMLPPPKRTARSQADHAPPSGKDNTAGGRLPLRQLDGNNPGERQPHDN